MSRPIVEVNISLDTRATERPTFNTAGLLSEHIWFKERVRSFTVESATDLPADSIERQALTAGFTPTIKPREIKLLRRQVDSTVFTVEVPSGAGVTYSLTLLDTSNNSIEATFTTSATPETTVDIAADLVADLAGATGVTITDNLDGTFVIARSGTEEFAVTALDGLGYDFSSSESATEAWSAILAEQNDFYFTATSSRDTDFVSELAGLVDATRDKQFFTSVQTTDNLQALTDTSNDLVSQFFNSQISKTSVWYHHESDTILPEMQYITVAAPSPPGTKVWGNNGVTAAGGTSAFARNLDTNLPLGVTEKNNLVAKNANYTELVGGIALTRYGQTSGGFWIDELRDTDFITAELLGALQDLLIRKDKLPYTQEGIAQVENTISTTLDRYSVPGSILDPANPYEINLPRRRDVSFASISSRNLTGEVTLYLTGAILHVTINGTSTFDAN